jgi:hypothetical protein
MCDVSALPLPDHPIRWRRPVAPADIGAGKLHLVPAGAVAAGMRADALVLLDGDESERRAAAGLGSVMSLAVLDALMSLPLGCEISLEDLNKREDRILRHAPTGCIDFSSGAVTRALRVPATVAAAVVRGTRWRAALRRAATFSPFTQRIVVLPATPSVAIALEAQVAGVGIWVVGEAGFAEFLAPEPFVPMYFKAAGWRFAENAYQAAADAGVVRGSAVEVGTKACPCC